MLNTQYTPVGFVARSILYMRGYKNNFSVGECYEYGRYVTQDISAAILCYQKAAQNGVVAAYSKLGNIYLQKNNVAQSLFNYWKGAVLGSQESKIALIESAAKGNIGANYYIGNVYEHEKNWTEAQLHYQQAIKGENASAMYRMGILYQQDRLSELTKVPIIKADKSQELSWYRRAAVSGSKYALDALIEASKSEAKAAVHLAEMYILGDSGIARNITQAMKYFHQASQLGSDEADFQMGLIYEVGVAEIKQDLSKAAEHYIRAAQKNHAKSLENLQRLAKQDSTMRLTHEVGLLYEQRKDKINALLWFKEASDKYHEKSSAKLKQMAEEDPQFAYADGQVYEKDPSNLRQACFYYTIAMFNNDDKAKQQLFSLVEKGESEAQYMLAINYYHRKKDLANAAYWCMKAAHGGSKEAANQLEQISNNDPNFAYALAQAYEKETDNAKEQAYRYYAKAALKGHKESFQHLEQLALARNKLAQYALGYHYYLALKDIDKAIDWCLLAADQDYKPAKEYITSTNFNISQCLLIARKFEEGRVINFDRTQAIYFYRKAVDLKCGEAAFRLAEIHRSILPLAHINLEIACEYYLTAARLGCQEAIVPLESLGRSMSTKIQIQIGRFFTEQNKFSKAKFWNEKIAEAASSTQATLGA